MVAGSAQMISFCEAGPDFLHRGLLAGEIGLRIGADRGGIEADRRVDLRPAARAGRRSPPRRRRSARSSRSCAPSPAPALAHLPCIVAGGSRRNSGPEPPSRPPRNRIALWLIDAREIRRTHFPDAARPVAVLRAAGHPDRGDDAAALHHRADLLFRDAGPVAWRGRAQRSLPCASWTPCPIRSSAGCPIAGGRPSDAGAASS